MLVTGFEPFGLDAVNPSQELAKALDGRRAGGIAVRAMVLPVQPEAARDALAHALAAPGLVGVVHFGLAGGRARLALEAVGLNRLDYSIPDARGDLRRDEPCEPGGPAAYWSTLPLGVILRELTAAGLPAYISYTAGTYLCNFTLYSTLHRLAGWAAPCRPVSSMCPTFRPWWPDTASRSRAWISARCGARPRSPSPSWRGPHAPDGCRAEPTEPGEPSGR